MGSPICVAERVWNDAVILRWYPGPIHYSRHYCYASARLAGVRIHRPYLHEVPLLVQLAAQEAHELMQAGQWTAAEAMATHRPQWSWRLLHRRAVPIVRTGLSCDGMPSRDPDQLVAVCGRLDQHDPHPVLGGSHG